MGQCKDCRWWDEPRRDGNGYGNCRLGESADKPPYTNPVHASTLAYAISYESADMLTKAEFGCVQFTGKDDAAH